MHVLNFVAAHHSQIHQEQMLQSARNIEKQRKAVDLSNIFYSINKIYRFDFLFIYYFNLKGADVTEKLMQLQREKAAWELEKKQQAGTFSSESIIILWRSQVQIIDWPLSFNLLTTL